MSGIATVLDLLRKNPNHYSLQFSASSAAVAASATAATCSPFASKFLFGSPRTQVAYCDDAGIAFPTDYLSNIRRVSGAFFESEDLKHATKEYYYETKPLFSAFEWKQLSMTTLRSLLMFYLPLLEPTTIFEDEEDEIQVDSTEGRSVDLVLPLKKSVKQIARETSMVTTRRVLERLAAHYVSQRTAWKLLKDVSKSAARKAERGLPATIYIFRVSRTTIRGHSLGVAASWIIQVGIEMYRFFARPSQSEEETVNQETSEQVKVLAKKVHGITIKCGASLIFASIGAGIGAAIIRPSLGQWIGCAAGDLAGPIVVSVYFGKYLGI